MNDNQQSKNNCTQPKVIEFKENAQCEILTENEINNLFLGFVNLIKKNVVFERERQYKKEINCCNMRISEYIIELNKKNSEITELKKRLKQLKNKMAG